MAILPGYEYDVFISYRHNDNRSGWVTEFVKALQEELAATIKEPISVYFDTNPHDGLLETHNVDKSLEGKLKCLIFIPIVSQTYCDPKSFAWQHEFCAFNKLVSEGARAPLSSGEGSGVRPDQFGRDIKLGNGNVASRILPVKIHNLDAEDKALLESELGGTLRAVEFIFKSAGVNRPLRADDKREENLNRQFYRDQINKVANALKEISNGMRFPGRKDTMEEPGKVSASEPGQDGKPVLDRNSKSIAVLPFINLAQDASQEYFADGITENILIQLASLRTLRVISRTSVMRYKKTTKSAPEIAAELGVKYILEGSAQAHGNKVRIQVQLIDAEKDDHVWSKVFVENMDDIFAIQSSVSEVVARELQSTLGPHENEKLKEVPTKSLEAYDLFLKGRHAFNQWGVEGYRAATEYFKQAIAKDPDFKQAYSFLASSYSARMSWNGDLSPGEAQKNIEIYLSEAWKRGPTDNDYLTKAFVEFFINKDFESSEKWLLQAMELGPNNAAILYTYSYVLNMMGRFEEAIEFVNRAEIIDPLTVAYYNYQTISLYLRNRHEEAISTVKEALQLYPSVLRLYDLLGRLYLSLGRYEETVDTVLSGLSVAKIRPPSMVAYLVASYTALKKEEKIPELLEELLVRSGRSEKGVNVYLMHAFHARGDSASARLWLEKARQTNDVDLIWWHVDPLLKNLRAQISNGEKTSDFPAAERHIMTLLETRMPKLSYHNLVHIKDVLNSAMVIAQHEQISGEEISLLRLAALFHDAGFIYSLANHEERGAAMAREILPGYGLDAGQIEKIVGMILVTHTPQMPVTRLEKIMCDADLDYLGRQDFYEVGRRLFEEMNSRGTVSTEEEWNVLQKAFLESHRYHTGYSKINREPFKKQRIQEIVNQLKVK